MKVFFRDSVLNSCNNPGGDWNPGRGDNRFIMPAEPIHHAIGNAQQLGHGEVGGRER